MEVFLWETYLLDADVAITACQMAMTAAVLLFGSSYCLAFAAMAMASSAVDVATAVVMAVATTVVSGLSYCFSSAVAAMASDLAVITAVATTIADAAHLGTTVAETLVETAVAANFFGNSPGGIFGCPSCHGSNPTLIETLKLFLPYFPLHIQNLINLYLKFLEFMHTFEMIQNMINHMDEYQALFKMFEGMGSEQSTSEHSNMPPFFGNSSFPMPDLSSMQKMMEGSDLVDEFTYVEEPSGTDWYGS